MRIGDRSGDIPAKSRDEKHVPCAEQSPARAIRLIAGRGRFRNGQPDAPLGWSIF